MTYARTRRHYRAAKKEVQQNPLNGIFIPNKDKHKLAAAAGALGVVVFTMGMLIGLLSAKD
jgi:hypothetical protein